MPKYLVQPVITSGGEHSLQRNARLGEPITIIAYANTYDASLFVEITDEFFFGLYPYGIGYPIFRRTKSGGGGNISHHVSENWKDKTAVFAVSHSGNLADTAKFYVDGQPKTTTVETSDTGAAAVTTNPVRLTPYRGGWPSSYNAGLPVLAIYNRELPAAEIRALSSKQFPSTLATCRRVLYFETAGGAVTINATPGDATAAGVSAQVLVGTLIQATPGNATADGAAAQVLVGVLIQATPADVTADGVTATVQVGSHTIIAASPALGEALGVTAQILVGTLVNAVPADAVAAGVAAQVLAAVLVQATPGEATAEGVDALVSIPGETTLTAADLDAIFSYEIEPGVTLLSALRIMFAPFAGKREGLGTATERYMAQDGTKPRITFSPTDAAGNGTPVVDGS